MKIEIEGIKIFPFEGEPVELSEEEAVFLGKLAEIALRELLDSKKRAPVWNWSIKVIRVSAIAAQAFLIQADNLYLEDWGVPGATRILKDYLFRHLGGTKVFDGGKGLTIARQLLAKIGRAYWTTLPNRETLDYLGVYELVYKD